jgi:hypothetical protein
VATGLGYVPGSVQGRDESLRLRKSKPGDALGRERLHFNCQWMVEEFRFHVIVV